MDREEFLNRVTSYGDLPSVEHAEQLTDTVLGTVGNRITAGQAHDLATYLPAEIGASLTATTNNAGAFGREEFLTRVAEYEDTDQLTADLRTRAVLRTLHEAVPENEAADTFAQLPRELYELFR